MFRLKARDRFEAQRFRAVKCVADGKITGVRQADNIAGQRLVNDQPFGAKEFIGSRQAVDFAGLGMYGTHTAFEHTGNDAHKGDAVTVFGVHIGLDLEDKAGKIFVLRRD